MEPLLLALTFLAGLVAGLAAGYPDVWLPVLRAWRQRSSEQRLALRRSRWPTAEQIRRALGRRDVPDDGSTPGLYHHLKSCHCSMCRDAEGR